MIRFFNCGKQRGIFPRNSLPFFPFAAVPLLLGEIAGSLFGIFSDSDGMMSLFSRVSEFPGSFWNGMLRSGGFILIAVFFSMGLPGLLLIPVLAFFLGFLFAGTVAFSFSFSSFSAVLSLFISAGIVAMLLLPACLICFSDGMAFSYGLLPSLQAGRRSFVSRTVLARRLLLIFALWLLSAAYSYYAAPYLFHFSV